MKDLRELQTHRRELLLAEVAGLLHNLGKLSSQFAQKFVTSATPAAKEYEFEFVLRGADAVQLTRGASLIRSKQGVALVRDLLDASIWNGDAPVAAALKAKLSQGATTSSVDGTRDHITKARKGATGTDTALNTQIEGVANRLASAVKLAELLQNTHLAAADILDRGVANGPQYAFLRDTRLSLLGADASLGQLVTLMWDDYHGLGAGQQREEGLAFWTGHTSILQRYLITSHGVISGLEKEKQADREKPKNPTDANHLYRMSAFGYEGDNDRVDPAALDSARDTWLTELVRTLGQALGPTASQQGLADAREYIVGLTSKALELGLGDTQRPINDITLWDYASFIAALFKSAVAKAVLEDHFVETRDLRWRLLSVRYDGLAYLGQADRVSDLLARRQALHAAHEAVRVLVETEYPLGNEIYRDENGSIFLVPHLTEDGADRSVLTMPVGDNDTFGELIARRFASTPRTQTVRGEERERPALGGELRPLIALNKPAGGEMGLTEKSISLPHAAGWTHPLLQPDPAIVETWWPDSDSDVDVCTVCGLRPQGYGTNDPEKQKKAQDRGVCYVCLERRDDRSEKWVTDTEEFARTIWMEEVADQNGRVALVTGRFGLDGWLDGSLIPTLSKSASFGRIRRCWRTTQAFWEAVQDALPGWVGEPRDRLELRPSAITDRTKLGRYHAYELDLKGRYLEVVWDPAGQRFITVENLEYAEGALGFGDLEASLRGRTVTVYEPSGHLARRASRTDIQIDRDGVRRLSRVYSPVIPLLSEPAIFMALVPATAALDVAHGIKERYELEMGKVRDRLPLHLGLVFAPRRTPVRALLAAARRFLDQPDVWETWRVQSASVQTDSDRSATDLKLDFDNGITWQIPLLLGGSQSSASPTEDKWHSWVLPLTSPGQPPVVGQARQAADLRPGDRIAVRPSRFDFEFLDTTVRALEISYEQTGASGSPIAHRRGSATRPFYLEDLDHLGRLWNSLASGPRPLETAQIQNLQGMLQGYVTEWFGGDIRRATAAPVYRQFALDVLHREDPSWWTGLDEAVRQEMERAVQDGTLLDLLELKMHILRERPEERVIAG